VALAGYGSDGARCDAHVRAYHAPVTVVQHRMRDFATARVHAEYCRFHTLARLFTTVRRLLHRHWTGGASALGRWTFGPTNDHRALRARFTGMFSTPHLAGLHIAQHAAS
jgi:hypothetical protein